MSNYQKFQHPAGYADETMGSHGRMQMPPPYHQPAVPLAPINANVLPTAPIVQISPMEELKSVKSNRRLLWVGFGLSIAMIFFQAIIDGVVPFPRIFPAGIDFPCTGGSGICFGVFGLVTAGLGICAFNNRFGNICIMVAYFVMLILSAIGDFTMAILAFICLGFLDMRLRWSYRSYYDPYDRYTPTASPDLIRGIMATESFLVIATLAHFITCIVSSAFLCRSWCCRKKEPPTSIVYLPTDGNQQQPIQGNETDPRRIAVPAGSQVIVVQLDHGRQTHIAAPPTSAVPL